MFSLIKGKAVAIVTAVIAAIGAVLVALIYREKSKRKGAELEKEKIVSGSAKKAADTLAKAQAADHEAIVNQRDIADKETESAKAGKRNHFE